MKKNTFLTIFSCLLFLSNQNILTMDNMDNFGFNQNVSSMNIFEAVKNNEIQQVKKLIKKNKRIVHKQDKNRITPLHIAAKEGYAAITKLLLENCAWPNVYTKDNWETPLHFAAENGHVAIVALLLEKEANPNVYTWKNKKTPLYLAVENGHIEIVRLLLHKKADPNSTCKSYSCSHIMDSKEKCYISPLNLALSKGYEDIAELLLKYNCEITILEKINKGYFWRHGIYNRQNLGADILAHTLTLPIQGIIALIAPPAILVTVPASIVGIPFLTRTIRVLANTRKTYKNSLDNNTINQYKKIAKFFVKKGVALDKKIWDLTIKNKQLQSIKLFVEHGANIKKIKNNIKNPKIRNYIQLIKSFDQSQNKLKFIINQKNNKEACNNLIRLTFCQFLQAKLKNPFLFYNLYQKSKKNKYKWLKDSIEESLFLQKGTTATDLDSIIREAVNEKKNNFFFADKKCKINYIIQSIKPREKDFRERIRFVANKY